MNQKIKEKLLKAKGNINDALSYFEERDPISNAYGYIKGDRFYIEWDVHTLKDYAMTTFYWRDDEPIKRHSAQRYRRERKDVHDGEDSVKFSSPTDVWNIIISVGEWDAETYSILPVFETPVFRIKKRDESNGNGGGDDNDHDNDENGGENDTPFKFSFVPVIKDVKGMANIHGAPTDHTLPPPSEDPDDWQILNNGKPVVHYKEVIGERKIDPVGFYLAENNLALFYNSGWANYERWYQIREERGYRPATTQAGSLIAFDEKWNFKDFAGNTVLDNPQRNWQGSNRTNPYALVWHPDHQVYYCFYGDFANNADNDLYPGRRALGVAKSTDLKNWEYLTVDKPLFHIRDMEDFHPETFKDISDITRQGRVYAYGATFHDGYIYLNVGGSTNRELSYSFIVRSKDPLTGWEYIRSNQHRPMPFRLGNMWYTVRNIRDPKDDNMRAIGLVKGRTLADLDHTPIYLFSTNKQASSGVSRQLFAYKGDWYIAYRQSDEDDNRSMYIARQKK